MKNSPDTFFATGEALSNKLENTKYEKQVDEFGAYKEELNEQIEEITAMMHEKCAEEMNSPE